MQIFYRNLFGKHKIINIDATKNFKYIREIIRDREGIPLDKWRLSFECRTYPDEKKISDTRLERDCTLVMYAPMNSNADSKRRNVHPDFFASKNFDQYCGGQVCDRMTRGDAKINFSKSKPQFEMYKRPSKLPSKLTVKIPPQIPPKPKSLSKETIVTQIPPKPKSLSKETIVTQKLPKPQFEMYKRPSKLPSKLTVKIPPQIPPKPKSLSKETIVTQKLPKPQFAVKCEIDQVSIENSTIWKTCPLYKSLSKCEQGKENVIPSPSVHIKINSNKYNRELRRNELNGGCKLEKRIDEITRIYDDKVKNLCETHVMEMTNMEASIRFEYGRILEKNDADFKALAETNKKLTEANKKLTEELIKTDEKYGILAISYESLRINSNETVTFLRKERNELKKAKFYTEVACDETKKSLKKLEKQFTESNVNNLSISRSSALGMRQIHAKELLFLEKESREKQKEYETKLATLNFENEKLTQKHATDINFVMDSLKHIKTVVVDMGKTFEEYKKDTKATIELTKFEIERRVKLEELMKVKFVKQKQNESDEIEAARLAKIKQAKLIAQRKAKLITAAKLENDRKIKQVKLIAQRNAKLITAAKLENDRKIKQVKLIAQRKAKLITAAKLENDYKIKQVKLIAQRKAAAEQNKLDQERIRLEKEERIRLRKEQLRLRKEQQEKAKEEQKSNENKIVQSIGLSMGKFFKLKE
jgi:hypothetical protein